MTLDEIKRSMPAEANLTGHKLPFYDDGMFVEMDGRTRWIYVGTDAYQLTTLRSLYYINRAAGLNLTHENLGAYIALFCSLMHDPDGETFDVVEGSVEVLGTNKFGSIMANVCTVHRRRVFVSLVAVTESGDVVMLDDELAAVLPDDQSLSSARA